MTENNTPTSTNLFKRLQHFVASLLISIVGWSKAITRDPATRARFIARLKKSVGSYTPPEWLTAAAQHLQRRLAAASVWVKARRKKVTFAVAGLVIATTGGVLAYRWYDSLPKPELVKISVTAPEPMDMAEHAVPYVLLVSFSQSAAPLTAVGKVVTTGIHLSPETEGVWRWNTDKELIFTPKSEWAVAQEYSIKIDKRKLLPSHVVLESNKVNFKTKDFSARLVKSEFFQDPRNPKQKRVIATLAFSHPVDPATLKDHVTMSLEAKSGGALLGGKQTSYGVTVTYNKFNSEAYLTSDNLPIPDDDSAMKIFVDSGIRSLRGGNSTPKKIEAQTDVPGMFNYFRIDAASLTLVRNDKYEPEQVLVITTTTEAASEDIQKSLSVYLLPKDKPALDGEPAHKNHRWQSSAELTPALRSQLTKVELELIPTEHASSTLHSFKFKATVGRSLLIQIKKGVKSFGEYVLARDFDSVARVPQFPKELVIMHNGSILSLAGEKKVSILSRNIDAIRYTIGRVIPSQLNHLITQSYGTFQKPNFENYNFTEENISEKFVQERLLDNSSRVATQYSALELDKYLTGGQGYKRGLFFLQVESYDPKTKTVTGLQDKRMILVTDLGLLAKKAADGSQQIFVQSIATGKPIEGATIDVLGKNGITVVSKATSADGQVSLPSLADFDHERAPVALLVHKGEDFSFLPLTNFDRGLNFSRFDVGGVTTHANEDRLTAYLFSDRGIYRPGDEIRLSYIVRSTSWSRNVAGVPVEVTLTDSRGLEIYKQKFQLDQNGVEELKYSTQDTSPTGSYTASVYVVKDGHRDSLLGSNTVRVEEFLPDRMKITTHLSQESTDGWVSPAELKGRVSLKNLFGTAAQNRRVAAEIRLSPSLPRFKGFADYLFIDPKRAEKSFQEHLEDSKTDDKGEAEFALDLNRFDKATYRLIFRAEGFDADGGRGVSSESTVLVSPLERLIGYKSDGDLSYMSRGTLRTVNFIAIDAKLKKVGAPGLTAQMIEEKYVSVLTKQDDGTYRYQSVQKEVPVSAKPLSVPANGLKYVLPSDHSGDFALVLKDTDGLELTRVKYSVVGSANLARGLDKNAELQVTLNKADFKQDEEIQMQIKAPYVGAGLITIERDRVYTYKWFQATTETTVQTIRVPQNLEGNAYVNVSFVRSLASKEIFMSPLSYGVAPFSISRAGRTNAIDLKVADRVKPGLPLKVHYKVERPGKIVIFAIDEGILQVAGYKNPDPLSFFFSKKALEVRTSQILDLILPEFSVMKSLSAPGGDEDARRALGQNLNPFKRKSDKPVAFWSGLVDAGVAEKTLSIDVPDYFNGQLRILAVAVAPEAVGVTEKNTLVRGDFVISPSLPTFVSPGDEFTVGVGVSNNNESANGGDAVELEVSTSDHLEILDGKKRPLKIKPGFEASAEFRVRAKDLLGSGTMTFIASQGPRSARAKLDLSVRPANPYLTALTTGAFKGSQEVAIDRNMYPHFRKLAVSASPLPLVVAHGLITYLNAFPYGCTEQVVSGAMPAVILKDRPDFGAVSADFATKSFSATLATLRTRQTPEGTFGYWTASSGVEKWPAIYALHFLTEARERGFNVPPEMLSRGLEYLKTSNEIQLADSLPNARAWAYALYVEARNGLVMSNQLSTLRNTVEKLYPKDWARDLTGIYMAATYQLLKQQAEADKIIFKSRFGDAQKPDFDHFYDPLTRDAQLLFVVAKHFPTHLLELTSDSIAPMLKPLSQGNYNTLNSAYLILGFDAFAAYLEKNNLAQGSNLKVQEIDGQGKARDLVVPAGLFPNVTFSESAKKVRISSTSDFNIFYQINQSGFDTAAPKTEVKNHLEIAREYTDGPGKVIQVVKLGTEALVHLKIRSLDNHTLHNVALVDLLPGGFEPVLEKVETGTAQAGEGSPAESGDSGGSGADSENGGGENIEPGDANNANEGEGAFYDFMKVLVPRVWAQTAALATDGLLAVPSSSFAPSFVDMREDRMVVFGAADPEMKEYIYKIKAVNRGTYRVPPAFGESMYDRTVQARALGTSITVE